MFNPTENHVSCPACESDNFHEVMDCEGSEGTVTLECEDCEFKWEADYP